MRDITPILRSLGLIESEIKTYISALDQGASTVLELNKVTGLSRQAVYVAINSLTQRGLMSVINQGKKRLFTAEKPEKLLAYAKRRELELEEKIKDLEQIIPELKLKTGKEKPLVRVLEGKEGLMAIMDDIKKSKPKFPYEISDIEAINNVLGARDLAKMRDSLKKAGVKGSRAIHAGVSQLEILPEGERQILPKESWGFKTNIGIYSDKVTLTTLEGKMHSVIIESEAITKTMALLFQLAWKALKE